MVTGVSTTSPSEPACGGAKPARPVPFPPPEVRPGDKQGVPPAAPDRRPADPPVATATGVGKRPVPPASPEVRSPVKPHRAPVRWLVARAYGSSGGAAGNGETGTVA